MVPERKPKNRPIVWAYRRLYVNSPHPYPPDFEINHDASRHEERRRRALKSLDPDDVLAVIEDLLASEPDPAQHPLYPMVLWLLDQALTPGSGGDFWDAWKQLALQAIDRLVDERLQGED